MKSFIVVALSLAVLATLGMAEEQAPELAVVPQALPQADFAELDADESAARNKRQFGYGGYGGGYGGGFGGGYGGYGGGYGGGYRGFGGGYGRRGFGGGYGGYGR